MRNIIAAITCVLVLSLLGGCSTRVVTPPTPTAPKVATSLVTSFTPRPGVRYYQPGVHAAGETSVGVGILRYRSISATLGEWLLTSCQGNALVSDMFPSGTNVISKPGLYNHPMGMNVVIGWMGETTGGVTTLYDRSPDSTQTPRAIARVMGAQRPDPRARVMEANVFVIKNGPVPLVQTINGMVYEPFFRTAAVGSPPESYHREHAGIKDLPDGRVRVVGTYLSRETSSHDTPLRVIAVEDLVEAPFASDYSAIVYLDDPERVVPKTAVAEGDYVGAEGKITKTGTRYRLAIDRFQTIPGAHRANITVR